MMWTDGMVNVDGRILVAALQTSQFFLKDVAEHGFNFFNLCRIKLDFCVKVRKQTSH